MPATLSGEPAPATLLAQVAAIAELAALEDGAYERTVAEQILVGLEHVLGSKLGATPEEEEFVVMVQGTFTEARRIGRDEGRAEGEARALLAVLRARGISVPDAARERILAQKDPEHLERWVERAAVAASVADVINEPSQAA
jgi:hypothetical protein